ncbi:hypothetical protein GCM10029964_041930 [Kibdelosporangium lantanae]
MQEEQVDVVGVQPPQAGLHRRDQALAVGAPEFGSPGRRNVEYFVATTRLSRWSRVNSPSMRSEVPLV